MCLLCGGRSGCLRLFVTPHALGAVDLSGGVWSGVVNVGVGVGVGVLPCFFQLGSD